MRKGLLGIFSVLILLVFILSFVSAVPAPCTTQELEDSSTYGILGKVTKVTCGETYEGYTGCKIEGDPKDILQRCVAKIEIKEVLYGNYQIGGYIERNFSKVYQKIGEASMGGCAPGRYSETFEVGDKIRYYNAETVCMWWRKTKLECISNNDCAAGETCVNKKSNYTQYPPLKECVKEQSWLCNPDYYGDGDCDCGCGIEDIDCVSGGCTTTGCYNSECEYCFAQNTQHSIGCPDEPECTWDYQCVARKVCEDGKCVEMRCPQYAPPGPHFCENGTIVSGGYDENGCILPPKCIPNTQEECKDSDGGKNHFVKGKILTEGLIGSGDGSGGEDYCVKEDGTTINNEGPYLIEYYCCEGFCADNEKILCANGCKDGACLKELECGNYRYNNCPEDCTQRCISSYCSEPDENGMIACTADCGNVPGSCVKKPISPCVAWGPLSPDWCKGGVIIVGGYDEDGCQNPPICIPKIGGCGSVHPDYRDDCCENNGYDEWDGDLNKCVGKETVCCKIYGYGAEMVEVNIRYGLTTKEECSVPDNFVGGNKEIVDDSYCRVEPIEKKYRYAYWECSNGEIERRGGETSCKTENSWKSYARNFCLENCGGRVSSCGVKNFGVLKECFYEPPVCGAYCDLECEYGYVPGSCNCQCVVPRPHCSLRPIVCSNGEIPEVIYTREDECPTYHCITPPQTPEQMCKRTGGEWAMFNNGCVDNCAYIRTLGTDDLVACTQATTKSCDCGPEMCWNGEKCEPNEVEPIPTCEDSCAMDGKCYPFGFRKSGNYCHEEGLFVEQQERWSECENHFECNSNICVENECISRGVMQAIMDFIERLFGKSYNNADDVVEAQ